MRPNYNGLLSYKHTDKEVLVYFPTRRSALRGVSPKSKGKSGLGLEAQPPQPPFSCTRPAGPFRLSVASVFANTQTTDLAS
jgi:hypothetical protein